MIKHWKLLVGATAAFTAVAQAGEMAAASSGKQPIADLSDAVVEEESSIFDDIWGLTTLYKGDGALNELSLIGRYHGQHYWTDADEQGDADGWDTRRWRLGVAAELFDRVDLEVQFNVDHESDRFFNDLEDVIVGIELAEGLDLSLGKLKVIASEEWMVSSKRIKTIERSLLVNQVIPKKLWGGLVHYDVNEDVTVHAGAFAGDLDGDWNFSEFDAGYLLNAAVDYQDFTLSYVYNDGDPGNNGAPNYDHTISLSYANYGSKGYEGLGIFTEAIYASGDDDVYGITIMPSYMLTSDLEAVLRYHFAGSDGDSGLRMQSRYDRRNDNLTSQRGDQYHGIYGGLNYYIYGDKLKLMGGVEYGSFDQDSGGSVDVISAIAGVRVYF